MHNPVNRDLFSGLRYRYLVKSSQWSIFNAAFWLVELLLGYKNKKFKKLKNWHFSKGVNPWFWSKNGHFLISFFLVYIGQKNVFHDILEWKDGFLGYKIKKFKMSKNWHFFKGVNPWFWSKHGHFSNFYFLGNIGQENLFYDILERKDVFLGYKNKKLEIRKIDIFPKGLTHGFGRKMAIFPNSFF